MTDGPAQPPVPGQPPAPTVVVGYPGSATGPGPNTTPTPGMAALRRQVRTLKYLLVACLALIIVATLGLGLVLAGSRAQFDDLSAQVAAVGVKADAAAQAAAATTSAPQAQEPAVTQLGSAPTLAGATIPAGADPTGAILIGDPGASDVVEVYVDYQCPYCQRWEQTIGKSLIEKAIQPGSGLLVKQYNLAFLGETNADLTPAGASARAASAAACVVNHDGAETFVAFSRAVFAAADPSEPAGQFTAPVLTKLATSAGASPEAIACIEDERNVPFVSATTKAGFGRGVGGTPTVVVNGETVGNPFTDPALAALVGG
jgi:protein-disulfide isomerase